MIFHLTHKHNWESAISKGFYDTASLYSEGFIHCSQNSQVMTILHRHFEKDVEVLLLVINESLLKAPWKYEASTSIPGLFPHVYGSINLDAVIEISTLKY